MDASNRGHARFGLFELDLESSELKREGKAVRLQAQPARVLALLVSRAGEIVTRRDIQHHVWRDNFVEFDQGLYYCIQQIRLALKDNADSPTFVETIPRQGYRFIAPVEYVTETDEKAESAQTRAVSRSLRPYIAIVLGVVLVSVFAFAIRVALQGAEESPGGRQMLVVMPFDSISPDPAQEYFSEGLTEELITTLSRLDPKQLGVIARTSAMRYKGEKRAVDQIKRELGVDYLLEGSVRSENGRARISVQLIRASDQSHVWAQSYDRPLNDMLEVQREVAQAVARNLSLELLPDAQFGPDSATTKPEVREAYLKARYLLNKRSQEDVERAIILLQSAIATDPAYAPAHTCLAQAYLNQRGALAERVAKAKQSLQTAEGLDDTLAETHLLLGYVALFGEWNWNTAKKHIERAIALDQGRAFSYHAYAAYLSTLGRHDDAIAQLQKAKELDPVSPAVLGDIGWIYYGAGRYDEAIKQSQEILELEPGEAFAHECLLYSYLRQGKKAEALSHARQIMKLRGATPQQIEAIGRSTAGESLREYWRWSLGWLGDNARRNYVDPCSFALIYADLGERELAFDYLQKAYGQRSELLIYLDVEPRFEPLRSDPRFARLLRRVRPE